MNPHLQILRDKLAAEIGRVRAIVSTGDTRDPEDFNVRGGLYALAHEIAPEARRQDIENLHAWIQPKPGELSIDLAAGTGFVTQYVPQWTHARVYAVDSSSVQLQTLQERFPHPLITTITGSPANPDVLDSIADAGKIDFVTSFGGIHHIVDNEGQNNQRKLFENIDAVLRPGGRFVAADVGAGTALSRHFEESVKIHCLTGHHEKWLSTERLAGELTAHMHLRHVRSEIVPLQWVFESVTQMALFMKAMHAYDISEEEIVRDLTTILGFEEKAGRVMLNWPMLFFEIVKKT